MLRLFPLFTLSLLLGPLLIGLLGTLGPAFNYLPGLERLEISFNPWRELSTEAVFYATLPITLFVGFFSTILAFAIVILFCATWHQSWLFKLAERLLAPSLAIPHSTLAFSVAFLLLPSGWLLRFVSPNLTGFQRPPDWLTVNDEWGIALTLGLVGKEVPYLLLMTFIALSQVNGERAYLNARMMGYRPFWAWLFAIFPLIYGRLKLPLFAVLAFSFSVVDMSLILGPTNPPTLSVWILRQFDDPDLSRRLIACAGAVVQILLVIGAMVAWQLGEWGFKWTAYLMLETGARMPQPRGLPTLLIVLMLGLFLMTLLGMLALTLWSFAFQWPFPDAFPRQFTLNHWLNHSTALQIAAFNTLFIGFTTALTALIFTLGCLENESRHPNLQPQRAEWLLYLPLIIPQIGFLFGVQLWLIYWDLDGTYWAVIWCHLVFVLPYAFLSLSHHYRQFDRRYIYTAQGLGVSLNKIFWRIKLPMLKSAILTTFAISFAVSASLYLPTLVSAAGRLSTLNVDAVTIAEGRNWRLIGLYGMVQMIMPMSLFLIAYLGSRKRC